MALWPLFAGRARAQGDGIYADFTTSMGDFTCMLDFTNAPRTAANFIGLATGERPWLDLTTGLVRSFPFYDGVTFHRVIAGLMIQGGSRNGRGTDGPGYAFEDEFSPSLRYDSFGVLAMANSGPDSNGSQFFIAVSPQSGWNDAYSVFGRLVSGSNVVYAINHVATDANDKPLTNVVIQTVSIRRIGQAAQEFDIHAQGLPGVTNLALHLSMASTNLSLSFSNRLYTENWLYWSSNLLQWTNLDLGIEAGPSFTNVIAHDKGGAEQFFRLAQARYSTALYPPRNLLGRTLTLNLDGGGTFNVGFDSSGGGSYSWTLGGTNAVSNYAWYQSPFTGKLWPLQMVGIVDMTLTLRFDDGTGGSVSGTAYPSTSSPFAVTGTFTLTGP